MCFRNTRRYCAAAIVIYAAICVLNDGAFNSFVYAKPQAGNGVDEVSKLLDRLHQLAAEADGDEYFALYSDDAVFLGTDPTERWDMDAFKAYALPIFKTGKGWEYRLKPGTRHITIQDDVAWFDELLDNDKYGTFRGSGVLKRVGEEWKIAQYNLTFTVPNEKAMGVVRTIRGEG